MLTRIFWWRMGLHLERIANKLWFAGPSDFINSFYQLAPRMRLEKSATRFVQQRGGTNLQLAKCELLPNRRPCFSHPAECCVDFATQPGTTHLPNPVQNGQAILWFLVIPWDFCMFYLRFCKVHTACWVTVCSCFFVFLLLFLQVSVVLFEALLDKSTMDNRLQESQASVLQHFMESWSHSRPSDASWCFIYLLFLHIISWMRQDWAMAAFPRLREILGTARSQVWSSFWTSLHILPIFASLPAAVLSSLTSKEQAVQTALRQGGHWREQAQINSSSSWGKRVCSESNYAGEESNVMALPSSRGSMRSHHWGSIWSSLHAWFAQFLWHCRNWNKKHSQCFCVS